MKASALPIIELFTLDVSKMESHQAQKHASTCMWRALTIGLLQDMRGQPCVDCGKTAVHHDHRDWRRPLDVEPVCHSCNLRRGPAAPFDTLPRVYSDRRIERKPNTHPMRGFALSMLEATTEPYDLEAA